MRGLKYLQVRRFTNLLIQANLQQLFYMQRAVAGEIESRMVRAKASTQEEPKKQ